MFGLKIFIHSKYSQITLVTLWKQTGLLNGKVDLFLSITGCGPQSSELLAFGFTTVAGKTSRLRILLIAGQRRLRAEGAGRARLTLTSQGKGISAPTCFPTNARQAQSAIHLVKAFGEAQGMHAAEENILMCRFNPVQLL